MFRSLLEEAGLVFGFVLVAGFVLLHAGVGSDVSTSAQGIEALKQFASNFS